MLPTERASAVVPALLAAGLHVLQVLAELAPVGAHVGQGDGVLHDACPARLHLWRVRHQELEVELGSRPCL